MAGKKVRVAIIGVGNCASSLVQGVQFYKNAKEDEDHSRHHAHTTWRLSRPRY